MTRHQTKTRVIGYLLLIVTVAALGVVTTTYARYAAETGGTGIVTVALWEGGSDLESLDIDVSGLEPGNEKAYSFQITNTKDGKVSKVVQNYSLTVETTGNLPLTYQIDGGVSAPADLGTVIGKQQMVFENGKAVAEGGILPHTDEAVHAYTLRVSWPADDDGADYADEIDLVTLTIDAEQAMPAA